ncbi:MAG: hypothetical protein P8X89_00350 [Reinekea sp.]
MLPKNWGEPMGAPAIFEKQIEVYLWFCFSECRIFLLEILRKSAPPIFHCDRH